MSKIQAIPTMAAGIQYRSRLEARWAIVLSTFGWKFEYEPEGLGLFRIFDFVLTDWQWPTLLEVKPAFTLAEVSEQRRELQDEARGWILDELRQRRKFFDELPVETVSLEEYDQVVEDIARVESGEDAINGRRAIVLGSTMHNDPVNDGVTVDGQHYVLHCPEIWPASAMSSEAPVPAGIGLGRLGERCLRCGRFGHRPVRASTVLGAWLAAGNTIQWKSGE